ncbi:hypothetical protein H3S88_07485 [Gilliamella sp. B14448G11]|uniref:hypothetical protein n=1 Tax=unclassified Gilliamella TaxID=2685620 RepID=UPI0018DC4561|nr:MULTISPECIES: hypothetical protein [unclassified Gilliamella]MBI0028731.1 hypothetical protein [Gilliamella sp. B14448G7]MBI0035503.1 hypothetical protein [Gilliamella sp. B14448G11]MBI0042676.1 hypothetical protein [Gilliamella sp. B14448G12]
MKKIRYHLMLIIGFFVTSVLTGCFCDRVEVRPKTLPNATFGTPYYAEIDINIRVIKRHFYYQIEPENSGLELSPTDFGTHVSFNDLKVKGTPKVAGAITIKLSGATYGTMSCPGKDFKKVYTIKVEE